METVRPRLARFAVIAALAAAVAVPVLQPLPARAAIEAVTLSDAQKAELARIEAYLNDLKTMQSRFVQISEDGVANGEMFLKRPGDMRIEYDPPTPVLMVASGSFVMYHDSQLNETSYVPVSETPVAFLLDEEIRFDDRLTVTGFHSGPKVIEVTLVESENPARGRVTLTFEDEPLRLAKWQVVDAQGTRVDVALTNPRFGVKLDSDLFSTVDPKLGIE